MAKGGGISVHQEIKILIIGLILGIGAILLSSSFRDLLDSFIQLTVPISEKALSGGYLFLWRFCFFILILAMLTIASICLV